MLRDPLLERMRRDGLLRPEFVRKLEEEDASTTSYEEPEDRRGFPDPLRSAVVPPHLIVLRLCHRGALDGGLSVALDVRADELIGPLCGAVGGSAKKVRVIDVRDRPHPELRISYGDLEEPWDVEDLYVLVQNLNDLLRADRQAKAIAVLGEWEDMLQLWCVPKDRLPKLLRKDYFAPRNRHQLESMVRLH